MVHPAVVPTVVTSVVPAVVVTAALTRPACLLVALPVSPAVSNKRLPEQLS